MKKLFLVGLVACVLVTSGCASFSVTGTAKLDYVKVPTSPVTSPVVVP